MTKMAGLALVVMISISFRTMNLKSVSNALDLVPLSIGFHFIQIIFFPKNKFLNPL